MDLSELATDTAKEAGTWVAYDAKTKFLIGAMGDRYQARLREMRDPLVKNLPRGEKLDQSIMDALVNQALVDVILLGWEGLMINGKELPFTKEAAKAALSSPALKVFRAWIIDQSMKFENFQLENFEDLMGNLLRSSSTTVQ